MTQLKNENMRKEDKQTPKETNAVEEISYQFKKLGGFTNASKI